MCNSFWRKTKTWLCLGDLNVSDINGTAITLHLFHRHHVLSMIIAIEIKGGLAEDPKKTVTVSLHQTCLHNVMVKLLVKQLHLLVLKQLLLIKHRKLLMMQIVVKNITDNR